MPDLSTGLRDLVEGALPDIELDSVVALGRRRRTRRRRRAGVAAVGVVALASATAVVVAGGRHDTSRVRVQSVSPTVASTAVPGDGLVPVSEPTGPSAVLDPLLALPACRDDGDFVSWARGALAPYDATAIPASTALVREPLAEVGRVTAMVRDPVPSGCVVAGRAGSATGWERRDAHGTVVVRGVSIASANVVPQRMLDHADRYHQESIATGQPLSGFVEGDAVEAVIGGRITVLSIGGLAANSYQAGVALEQRLYLAKVKQPTDTDTVVGAPTRMVPGLSLCSVPADYCDGTGRSIAVNTVQSLPLTGEKFTINGQRAVATQDRDGTRHLTVALPFPGYTLQATGIGGITASQLVAVMRSVPLLTNAYLHPGSGTRDLRASFGETWLRHVLQLSGARDVTITLPSHSPTPTPGSTDKFLEATFATADAASVHGTFGAQAPLVLPPLPHVVKLGTVEFQTDDRQTFGYCNDIFVNIIDMTSHKSAEIAGAVVRVLGC